MWMQLLVTKTAENIGVSHLSFVTENTFQKMIQSKVVAELVKNGTLFLPLTP